jgi:signal transduction histidine kinase
MPYWHSLRCRDDVHQTWGHFLQGLALLGWTIAATYPSKRGTIEVETQPDEYTEFRIILPRAQLHS